MTSFREARDQVTGDSWSDDLARASLAAAASKHDPRDYAGEMGTASVLMTHCVMQGADVSEGGIRVKPGGSIVGGLLVIRDGAVIRALDDGGFIIEPAPGNPDGTDCTRIELQ